MKKFWIMWTYFANYGGPILVGAETPDEAVKFVSSAYSEDFKERADVYVFDSPPSFARDSLIGRADEDQHHHGEERLRR